MSKKGFGFTDQWFKDRDYTPDGNGGWISPKFKNPLKNKSNGLLMQSIVIPKEKVNNSPDFTHKLPTEWTIPYQIPSKKNSRQTFVKNGKIINIPSKRYSEYVRVTRKYWKVFGCEFQKTVDTLKLTYPLNVEFSYVRKTNQIVDWLGPTESAMDIMTDFGWWQDDNSRIVKPHFGTMQVDKLNPCIRIKILL